MLTASKTQSAAILVVQNNNTLLMKDQHTNIAQWAKLARHAAKRMQFHLRWLE